MLFRCSNTVVTFYTLFNIKTISYWPLQFSHFFASFSSACYCCYCYGALPIHAFLSKPKKKKKKKAKEHKKKSSLMWKKDKKQLWNDTFREFEETFYEPFGSIVGANDVLFWAFWENWKFVVATRLEITSSHHWIAHQLYFVNINLQRGCGEFPEIIICDKKTLYKFFIMQMATNTQKCEMIKKNAPPSFEWENIVKKACCCASIVSIFAFFFVFFFFALNKPTNRVQTINLVNGF